MYSGALTMHFLFFTMHLNVFQCARMKAFFSGIFREFILLALTQKCRKFKQSPRERVCQDDFCKFSKFKYLSAEKSPNISCLHIS